MNITQIFSSRVVLFALFAVHVLWTGPASADFLGKFQDWEAHARTDGGAKVCYAASVPLKSEGKYTVRGDVFLLVSHRPGDRMIGFVSMEAGYTYGKDGKIIARIGSDNFPMFADGELAFAYEDPPLVKAMIRGQNMIVQGTSSRGTRTTDTFSLSGFTAAYSAASRACDVKGEP
ncbi:MAG: invasion associated locus B family protein [Rhodospirillales bacterium]